MLLDVLGIKYPIEMNDWAKNYNEVKSYCVRMYSNGNQTTEWNFNSALEAFTKFKELIEIHKCYPDDFPGGTDGEFWMSWMPNFDNARKFGIGSVEIMLIGKYDQRVNQFGWGRCWVPVVCETIRKEFEACDPDFIFDVWDERFVDPSELIDPNNDYCDAGDIHKYVHFSGDVCDWHGIKDGDSSMRR